MAQPMANGKKQVTFKFISDPGCAVYVAGSFNQWDPTVCRLKDNPRSGIYVAKLSVPAGRHEYKFVVNGQWCADPAAPDTVPDGYGSMNSVVFA